MDVEYENYAHRASAHADDAETDEEIVIKYRRHRVEPQHLSNNLYDSEDTNVKALPPPSSFINRLLHAGKSWYRKAIGTSDTATLKHKAEEKVDEGVRKIDEKGGKLADYAEEGVEKASKLAQHVVDDFKDALEKEKERVKAVGEDGSHAADHGSDKVNEKASQYGYRTQATGDSWTAWLSNTASSAWESIKSTFDSLWSGKLGNQRRKAHEDKLRDARKLQQETERRKEELRQVGKTVDTAGAGKAKLEELVNESAELGKQKYAESSGWLKEGVERQKAKLEEAVHDVAKMAQDTAEAGKEKIGAVAQEAAYKVKGGAEKAEEAAGWIREQVKTKAKEGVQESADWLKARVEAGRSKMDEVVQNVQGEVHAVKAGMDAAKEKAKENVRSDAGRVKETVVDGIHNVERVGEGFIEAVERGGEKIYHVGEEIKEAVEHGGQKIYRGGVSMVKEGAERAARPFVRDTQIHRDKINGNYIPASAGDIPLPKQVLAIGDVAPLSTFFAGILGFIFLVLAYRVHRNRGRSELVISEHHSVARRHAFVAVKEKPRKGRSQSQETLSENSIIEADAVTQVYNESVESLNTFTQNTSVALLLLTLNEIAGYQAPLVTTGYFFYIIGSLLNAFGGYDTPVGNNRRENGLHLAWAVIGFSSLMNLSAGLWDNGILL